MRITIFIKAKFKSLSQLSMRYHYILLSALFLVLSSKSKAQESPPEIYDAAYNAYDNFKYKKAIKLFESIADNYRDSVDYYLILGICYSEVGKNKEAIDTYNQSLKLDPNFDQAYIQRGISYFAESENSKAIKDFKQAIMLNPDNPEVYLNLGTVKYDSGDEYGACKEWRKARDMGLEVANQMIEDVCKR